MLPKAHLTIYSRMSGSRWVTSPSWFSRLLTSFFYSSAFSCHFLLICFVSASSLLCQSFLVMIFAWNVPLLSPIFLNSSLVFPILLFFSISLHCSLKKASYLSLLFSRTLYSVWYIFPFLHCLSLLFFSHLFVRLPQTIILSSCISFSWGWFWSLLPLQCYKPPSTVSSETLSTRSKPLKLFIISTV